jgi:subtilisin family serine protease
MLMLRPVSISTALSVLLLSSSAFTAMAKPSESLREALDRPKSPIHIVYHDGEEVVAVNHKKIIGAEGAHRQGITGSGAKVLVVEGNFDPTHSDYAGNLTTSTLAAANVSEGLLTDYMIRPLATYLEGGHAAHVSGTIAGKTGVAPDADLRVIDYTKEAFVPHEDVTVSAERSVRKALQIAAQSKGDVVNLSQALVHKALHETRGISSETRKAMINVAQSGKIIVMAAGNEEIELGTDAYTKSLVELAASPEMKGRLMLVGALGYGHFQERITPFSDKPSLQARAHYITAPGEDIDGPNSYDRRHNADGTSMAAPMVSGALALVMEAAPGLKPEDYVRIIQNSARRKSLNDSMLFSSAMYGNGVLDVQAAIDLARKEYKGTQVKKASASKAPRVAPPSFVDKAKNVIGSVAQKAYSAIKGAVGSALKSGVSRLLGWSW